MLPDPAEQGSTGTGESTNPFPGLRPFEKRDGRRFFGRTTQTKELLIRLANNHFLATIGVSGSGKSSLVRAGLIPELHKGRLSGPRSGWRIALLRPGDVPIESLATALAYGKALGPHRDYLEVLRGGSGGLLKAAEDLEEDDNLLIVVDQFEEVFRFSDCSDTRKGKAGEEAKEFVRLLLSGLEDSRVHVVITMRSDYLGDCAQFRDLPEKINQGQYLIPRLTIKEQEEIIQRPIWGRGAEVTERLVQRLVMDVGDEPRQLPVLQHLLMRIWEKWAELEPGGKVEIDLPHYDAVGGFQNALNIHAKEVFNEFDPEEQSIVRKLFCRITRKDQDRVIRDPAKLEAIYFLTGAASDPKRQKMVRDIIDRFRREHCNFLTSPQEGELGADSMIDITHESLCELWDDLKEWVRIEAESAWWYGRMSESAKLYLKDKMRGPCDEHELSHIQKTYRPGEPDGWNEVWSRRYEGNYDDGLRKGENRRYQDVLLYLKESAESHEAAERDRRERQLARESEERQRQEQDFRNKRRFGVALSLLVLFVFMIAGAVAIAKWIIWRSAAETLAAQSKGWRNALGSDSQDRAALLELSSYKTYPLEDNSDLAEWESYDRLTKEYASLNIKEPVAQLVFSPNGFGSDESRLILTTLRAPQQRVVKVEFPRPGTPARLFEESGLIPPNTTINQDGRIGITACVKTSARVFQLGNPGPDLLKINDCEDSIKSVEESAPGGLIAVLDGAGGNRLRVFGTDGNVMAKFPLDEPAPGLIFRRFALSRDGKYIAMVMSDDNIFLFDLSSNPSSPLVADQNSTPNFEFSNDSKYFAVGLRDGKVRIWKLGASFSEVLGQVAQDKSSTKLDGQITALAFSPTRNRLAFAADNAEVTLRMVDLESGNIEWSDFFKSPILQIAFTPDGNGVGLAVAESTARVLDARDGFEMTRVTHKGKVNSIAFAADPAGPNQTGKESAAMDKRRWILFSGSDDGTVRMSDAQHARPPEEVELLCKPRTVAWGSDRILANCANDENAPTVVQTCLFSVSQKNSSRILEPAFCVIPSEIPDVAAPSVGSENNAKASDGPCAIAISRDGERIGMGCGSSKIALYNNKKEPITEFGAAVQRDWLHPEPGHFGSHATRPTFTAMAISPSGKQVAFGDSLGHVVLFEETGSWKKRWACTATKAPPGAYQPTPGCAEIVDSRAHKEASVLSLAFGYDLTNGTLKLGVGNAEGDIFVEDLEPVKKSNASRHTQGEVRALAFSSDTTLLAYGNGSFAGVMRADGGGEIASVSHRKPVVAVAFSPDSQTVASADEGGKAIIFSSKTKTLDSALELLLRWFGYGPPAPTGQRSLTWEGNRNQALSIFTLRFDQQSNLELAAEKKRAWAEQQKEKENLVLTRHGTMIESHATICQNVNIGLILPEINATGFCADGSPGMLKRTWDSLNVLLGSRRLKRASD